MDKKLHKYANSVSNQSWKEKQGREQGRYQHNEKLIFANSMTTENMSQDLAAGTKYYNSVNISANSVRMKLRMKQREQAHKWHESWLF